MMAAVAAFALVACSSPLPDEHIAEVEQAWVPAQNNPACGAAACSGGQVVTCGNICVTPVAIGGSCTQVDCQPTSVCAGHLGASCTDVMSNGVYTCALPPVGKGILSACNPAKNECPADTYCKDNHTCYPSSSSASFCAVGVEEGYACDSDWTSVYNITTNPKCAPCMPNTTCIGGFCHKPCSPSLNGADCPCGNFGEVNKCYTNPTSGVSDCYECGAALHDNCDAEHPCCATTQKCGGASTCCKNIGQACTAQTDCCGSAEVCLATHQCGACKVANATCTVTADCCGGTSCTAGLCKPAPCVAGGACTANAVGECANSTWTCNTSGMKVCLPKLATTETCNGKDDDCNGKTDDIPSTSCATPIASDVAACQSGFVTTGHLACENGNTVCRAKAQLDYCAICGTDDNGVDCGTCQNTPCTVATSKCTPNFTCNAGSLTCVNNAGSCSNPTPICWHPNNVGTGANCYAP